MKPNDKAWVDGYFTGYQVGKEEGDPMEFTTLGTAYAGSSDSGKSYIRIVTDPRKLKALHDTDLEQGKLYLFKSHSVQGQYAVCAPLRDDWQTFSTVSANAGTII